MSGSSERPGTPVLAPVAAGADGGALNVDADRLAARVAAALGARALVLLTNAPGLLADAEDPRSVVRTLDGTDVAALDAADAAARGRMRKKTLAAREALDGGVARVVIATSAGSAPLANALAGGGTHFLGASAPREVTR